MCAALLRPGQNRILDILLGLQVDYISTLYNWHLFRVSREPGTHQQLEVGSVDGIAVLECNLS